MRATAYLYVITERYPKSGTPALNSNNPRMICRSEEQAKFIVADLRRLSAKGEPITYEYVRVPFVEVPDLIIAGAPSAD